MALPAVGFRPAGRGAVVAGAVIGPVVGRAIVNRHDHPKAGALARAPYFDGHAEGLMFHKDF